MCSCLEFNGLTADLEDLFFGFVIRELVVVPICRINILQSEDHGGGLRLNVLLALLRFGRNKLSVLVTEFFDVFFFNVKAGNRAF